MAMQLIPLHSRSINEQTLDTVNARELHSFLGIGRHFATWLNARIKQYGFEMDVDYTIISRDPKWGNGNRGATKEYFITLDMAKELAMSNATKRANKPAATSSTAKNNSTSKNTFPPPRPTRQPSKPTSKKQKSTKSSTM